MNKIIVIAGPTGVGKTKLSIMLAKKYNGEIINADSMQIYQNLNIGTAKVTEAEKQNIPHHLFDIKTVEENYSIYDYQNDCRKTIEEIKKRKKTPILVGGTGLYIKSALYDYKFTENTTDSTNYDKYSTTELYEKLISQDKDCLGKIDKNNRRRIINALNFFKKNQISITKNITDKLLYDCIFIGLTTERAELYEIINNRVDAMLEKGLIEEVKKYHEKNIRTKPLIGGIGYKEVYNYLDKKINYEEMVNLIKKNSRNYAKRQYTFFNNKLKIKWFNVNYVDFNVTFKEVVNYIDSTNE